jgi:hypothetical protein
MHGIAYDKEERESIFGEKLMTKDMGGDVAEFLKANIGVEYYCLGVHDNNTEPIHVAREFYGYPHGGGLKDSKGNRWWIFIYCDEPVKKGTSHQTSFVHFPGEVQRAKAIREEGF